MKAVTRSPQGAGRVGIARRHGAVPVRRDEAARSRQAIPLESGDAFVFGGPARLRYHGVAGIVPATAPSALGLAGRFNLTFRRY